MRVSFLLVHLLSIPLYAGETLPRIDDADWNAVRLDTRKLLAVLKDVESIPPTVNEELKTLLKDDSGKAEKNLERLQDLLDPFCLVGVHINPESRVKAARGAFAASLVKDRVTLVLVKVHNEGGITAPLAIAGDELRTKDAKDGTRWLEASIVPADGRLSGRRLEYVVLRLLPREHGKREATLKFDAGQGTQDLGFRAEVPILFRVSPR